MRAERAAPSPSLSLVVAWVAALALLASLFLPAEVTRIGSISFFQFVSTLASRLTTIEWIIVVLLLVGTGVAIIALTTEALEPGLEESAGWSAFAGFAAALAGEALWAVDFFGHGAQLRPLGASVGLGVWIGSVAAWIGLAASLNIARTAFHRWAAMAPPLPDFPLPGVYVEGSEIGDVPPAAMLATTGSTARLSYVEEARPIEVVVEEGSRIIIGSADVADVRIRDPRVSPQQAMLEWHDGHWLITDLTPGNPMDIIDSTGRSRRIYGRASVTSGRILIGDVGLTLHPGQTIPT